MWACYKGHVETASLLIEQRAEVNVHGQFHITPLMWAAGRGHTAIVRLLLNHGAKVNVGDKVFSNFLLALIAQNSAHLHNGLIPVWNDRSYLGMPEILHRNRGHASSGRRKRRSVRHCK